MSRGRPAPPYWLLAAARPRRGAGCRLSLLLFSTFVVQPFLIPSGSMEPTLQVGDRVLVNKLAYRFGAEPRRGDVVVFDGTGSFVREDRTRTRWPAGPRGGRLPGLAEPADTDFVKRVVGVGGDRVVCCDKRGRLEVNGGAGRRARICTPGTAASKAPFDIVVPAGHALGAWATTAADSSDSRDHLGSPGRRHGPRRAT